MEENIKYQLDKGSEGVNKFDLLFDQDSPPTWIPAVFHLIAFNYNSIEFVDDFLESISKQTLERFDTFIIDLGSTDGSWEKINKWKPRTGIVSRTMQRKDLTPFSALNTAAHISVSLNNRSYLCPINVSDRLSPGALRNYFSYAERNPEVDLFYANFKIVDDKKHKNVIGYQNWPEYSHEGLAEENFCGCSPLIKGMSFINAGMYPTYNGYVADYSLYLKMSEDELNFFRIEEVIGSHYEGVTSPNVYDQYNKELEELQGLYRIPKL
jgi:glycosyltransferase involved in cell wall biosynthesis